MTTRKKLVYAALTVAVMLGSLELVTRGFGYPAKGSRPKLDRHVVDIEVNEPRPGYWDLVPNRLGINADGFIGPIIGRPRTKGVPRIAVLGDSCTQFGAPPYAELLRSLLEKSLGGPVEVLNAGVLRHSTEQGRIRLQAVLPFQPDIVTLFYGWNDHWMDGVCSDEEEMASWRTRLAFQAKRLDGLALFAAGRELANAVLGSRDDPRGPASTVFRVPIERYRVNLTAMIQTIREMGEGAGAVPVLITAPADLRDADNPWRLLPRVIEPGGRTQAQVHAEYVDATRSVARAHQVHLVNAYEAFGADPTFFTSDRIHLSPAGHEKLAELLAASMMEWLGDTAKAGRPGRDG